MDESGGVSAKAMCEALSVSMATIRGSCFMRYPYVCVIELMSVMTGPAVAREKGLESGVRAISVKPEVEKDPRSRGYGTKRGRWSFRGRIRRFVRRL